MRAAEKYDVEVLGITLSPEQVAGAEEEIARRALEKYIFSWGYIPSYREVVWQLPEHSFWLLDVENIRRHYSLTAERWADNFAENRDKVVEKFDEEFARMWELFLAGVVATFRYLGTSVHQFLFSKGINNELPLTRDYIYK